MRTLIRSTTTGLYLQGPGQWTANPQEAFNFRLKALATQKAAAWQLCDVELAFALEHSQELLATMPLGQTCLARPTLTPTEAAGLHS